jgi:hypothetical protein
MVMLKRSKRLWACLVAPPHPVMQVMFAPCAYVGVCLIVETRLATPRTSIHHGCLRQTCGMVFLHLHKTLCLHAASSMDMVSSPPRPPRWVLLQGCPWPWGSGASREDTLWLEDAEPVANEGAAVVCRRVVAIGLVLVGGWRFAASPSLTAPPRYLYLSYYFLSINLHLIYYFLSIINLIEFSII